MVPKNKESKDSRNIKTGKSNGRECADCGENTGSLYFNKGMWYCADCSPYFKEHIL